MYYKREVSKHGGKITKVINGIHYYKASCPLCGCAWFVKKNDGTTKSDYHPVVP